MNTIGSMEKQWMQLHMFIAFLLKHLHKSTQACFVLLTAKISVSITSIHA